MREQFKLASFVGGLLRASRPPDFARLFFLEVVKERLFTNLADTPKNKNNFLSVSTTPHLIKGVPLWCKLQP